VATLTRRTQLLLDEDRYQLLVERSRETGRPVAALIREAIDQALAESVSERRRRAAGDFLREARENPDPGPQKDWEVLKEAMLDDRAKRFDR